MQIIASCLFVFPLPVVVVVIVAVTDCDLHRTQVTAQPGPRPTAS